MHWMIEQIPRWLVHSGILTRPAEPDSGPQIWLDKLHHLANDLGLYLGYLAIALVLIALIRRMPYHWFRRLHKVFPVAFLVMAFHALVLLPRTLWLKPVGLIVAVCIVAGTIAALRVLTGRTGQARRHQGTVSAVRTLGDGVLEVECAVDGPGLAHRAGQFVFVRFAGARDPHPFTIASGGADPRRLRLCIKALGDDTRALAQALSKGSPSHSKGRMAGSISANTAAAIRSGSARASASRRSWRGWKRWSRSQRCPGPRGCISAHPRRIRWPRGYAHCASRPGSISICSTPRPTTRSNCAPP
jgi:predicted ferric reductase